jgi:hypothetical protein
MTSIGLPILRVSIDPTKIRGGRWRLSASADRIGAKLEGSGAKSEDAPGRPITIRSSMYLNTLIEQDEQDHRAIKFRIGPMLGFEDFVSAQITLAGVELLHRFRQGQFALRKLGVAKEDGAGDLECGARRLRRKAFKIDLGLQISTLHQSPTRRPTSLGSICSMYFTIPVAGRCDMM